MKVHELIANLHEVDPEGESDVGIYICRRYGGHQSEAMVVRRFVPGGDVMIADERDDEL